ncbi:MAG: MerR family transcriptional regulator [Candidatus Symbiothrix sp.]|jgi:DNA-binding transcriptional MerR regulator|nr:MerR family transcriptional regulator [Candidatus Symbiothrix sp.]
MPAPKFNTEKIWYTTKEVATMFDFNESKLRYWEKYFPNIKPKITKSNRYLYGKKEIEIIRRIHQLVDVEGLTLEGAKQKLKTNWESVGKTGEIVDRLKFVRQELMSLKDEFSEMEKTYSLV